MEEILTGPHSLPGVSAEAVGQQVESITTFLDEFYRDDFARDNPGLVGTLALACAIHSGSVLMAQQIRTGLREIAESHNLHRIWRAASED
jgi:hypothetical protein